MENNIILTFNVTLNELDVLLGSLTKHEGVIRDLKDKIFKEANNQMESFYNNAPAVKEDDVEQIIIEDNEEIENLKEEGEKTNE